jgi:uncharacterized integral membrane protein
MKNTVALIFSILILILTVIFTLQNAQMAHIKFLSWHIEASLSLILFTTFGVGILCAVTVLLPVIYKLKAHQKNLNKKIMVIEKLNSTGENK